MVDNLISALDGDRDEELRFLLPRFYRYVAIDDVAGMSVPALIGQVSLVRDLAQRRPVGESNMLIGRDDDGRATVAAVVTDDMPFLVDSVTAALTKDGRVIRLVMHPQFVVERDTDGNLTRILDSDVAEPLPSGAVAESWMCFRMDRDFTLDDETQIVEHVSRVLNDVRATVSDWGLMAAQARRTG